MIHAGDRDDLDARPDEEGFVRDVDLAPIDGPFHDLDAKNVAQ